MQRANSDGFDTFVAAGAAAVVVLSLRSSLTLFQFRSYRNLDTSKNIVRQFEEMHLSELHAISWNIHYVDNGECY